MANKKRLRVPNSVAERLRNLHPEIRNRIRQGLDQVLADPTAGKELREEPAGLRSYRVGRYRIVYRIEADLVALVNVGPRSAIYSETAKLLKNPSEDP